MALKEYNAIKILKNTQSLWKFMQKSRRNRESMFLFYFFGDVDANVHGEVDGGLYFTILQNF